MPTDTTGGEGECAPVTARAVLAALAEVRRRGQWPLLQRLEQREQRETVFGITSLPRAEADAGRLRTIVRCHWSVEVLFHVRDVTLGEDACRVRSDDA